MIKSITLSDAEMLVCKMLGGMRSIVGKTSGVKDAKVSDLPRLQVDEDGMIGEYAFCKLMNVFPDIVPGPRSGSFDCVLKGKRIDVKSTRYKNGNLLATMKENPDVDVYVLALIEGNTVSFPGYASIEALIKPENIADLGHGKGYALCQEKLTPWKT